MRTRNSEISRITPSKNFHFEQLKANIHNYVVSMSTKQCIFHLISQRVILKPLPDSPSFLCDRHCRLGKTERRWQVFQTISRLSSQKTMAVLKFNITYVSVFCYGKALQSRGTQQFFRFYNHCMVISESLGGILNRWNGRRRINARPMLRATQSLLVVNIWPISR